MSAETEFLKYEFLKDELARMTSDRNRWREDSMRQAATITRLAQAAEDRNEVDKERQKMIEASDAECLEWAEKNVSKIVAMNDANGAWWQVRHNLDHTSGKTLMEALENAMRKS